MVTTIEVNKQSVKQLLETGKTKKFVIPEYQRPYAWSDEQIQILFDDLVEYTADNNDSTYFLGTVVSYDNDSNEQEIIDGQQRITTLFLLLRAVYEKLEASEEKEAIYLRSQIRPALWEQDDLTGEVKQDSVLISSRVMGDGGNEELTQILKSGSANSLSNSNYAKNYIMLQNLIESFAANRPLSFYRFISNILNKAILLPITADSQDTALTIFSTLNDRGLALSDADIFKAKIYNHLTTDCKINFIEQWRKLEEEAVDAGESIQKLFYYYMFYLRALDNDRNTTTPGIRKYYSKDNYKRLFHQNLMDNLVILLNLWVVVNNRVEIEEEPWSRNKKIQQILDALSSYPNEFWKYPVVTYYLQHRDRDEFESAFLVFLRKLFTALAARYIVTPTINAVKRSILNLNSEIIRSDSPQFDFNKVDEKELRDCTKVAHRNTVRMILKVLAYRHQDNLLPKNWEIEHIFPQKWQSTFFQSTPEKEVKELVEHIGNKIPFEKKLNIIASNSYFLKKQVSYRESEIQIVAILSSQYTNWGLDEIRERDIRVSDELYDIFVDWGLNELKPTVDEKHRVSVPDDRKNDYRKFLAMFKMTDTDENRNRFNNISK